MVSVTHVIVNQINILIYYTMLQKYMYICRSQQTLTIMIDSKSISIIITLSNNVLVKIIREKLSLEKKLSSSSTNLLGK